MPQKFKNARHDVCSVPLRCDAFEGEAKYEYAVVVATISNAGTCTGSGVGKYREGIVADRYDAVNRW
jgi:hypothetical protein